MKKKLLLQFCLLSFFTGVWSQEFLLHDETFTWHKDDDVCGGYHYWYDRGNGPVNWKTPYDYQNGQYYFRFQVINQPSSEPFTLNMCIWTEYLNGSWKEECVGFSPVLAGPGSLVTYNSPVTYQLNGVHIDWTDLTKLWRMGNPLFINGKNLGNGPYCTDHPELWTLVDSYLPLTMRVTVVAVAAGYSFSGWDNYVGGCTPAQQATPTYGIDYTSEKTDKVISTTDEYSYDSQMSEATSGTEQKLTLTPGQDVYFRTRANGECWLASDIQHLVVPARSAEPSVSIDFTNEMTAQSIASTTEYSIQADMSGSLNGTGVVLSLTPGNDLYFRTMATGSSFRSGIQHLIVPSRPVEPSVSVDFTNESTGENIASTLEYSIQADMSGSLNGTDVVLGLTPGNDLYFRTKATVSSFRSGIQHLVVPARPAEPSVSIDFTHERTTESFASTTEYSPQGDMSGSQSGTGVVLNLTPGTDCYFRVKSAASSFASGVFHLVVPERPVINTAVGDTLQADFFTAALDFHTEASGFDATDMEATNADVVLTEPLTIKVIPVATGEVTVKVIANAISAGNFVSDVLTTFYKEVVSSIPDAVGLKGSISVYPVPVNNKLMVETSLSNILPAEIILMDIRGSVMLRVKMESKRIALDMSSVPQGMYIMKTIDSAGNVMTGKVIKQ
jgi:hypothetical protein